MDYSDNLNVELCSILKEIKDSFDKKQEWDLLIRLRDSYDKLDMITAGREIYTTPYNSDFQEVNHKVGMICEEHIGGYYPTHIRAPDLLKTVKAFSWKLLKPQEKDESEEGPWWPLFRS